MADARAGFIDRIYITFPMRAEERIRGVLTKLADTTASVYIVPDFFVFQMLHSRWTDIGGLPAVSVFENPLYGVDGLVKRVFDLVVAALLLVVLGRADARSSRSPSSSPAAGRCSSASGATAWTAAKSWSGNSAR